MRSTRLRRLVAVFVVMLLLTLVVAASVQATELVQGPTIGADEVIDDDVFIGGERVTVDGIVKGNLFAAGTDVTINGDVEGSLFVAGQVVKVNGRVDGSVFAGASHVILGRSAEVGRNMYAGCLGLDVESGSVVGRDLLVGAYQAVLEGEVARDVRAGVGALEINGSVGRDVHVDVGDPGDTVSMPSAFGPPGAPPMIAQGLRVSSDASIGGELVYTSPSEQGSSILARPEGGIAYQTPTPSDTDEKTERVASRSFGRRAWRWFLRRLREFVSLLVLGLLAMSLIPEKMDALAAKARSDTVPALGWGFLALIAGYVGAAVIAGVLLMVGILLAIISLGGLSSVWFGIGFSSLGLAFGVFTALVVYGSKLVVALWIGKLIAQSADTPPRTQRIVGGVLGIVIYVIVRGIPILGWIASVVVTLIGLGAIVLWYRDKRAGQGEAVQEAPPLEAVS